MNFLPTDSLNLKHFFSSNLGNCDRIKKSSAYAIRIQNNCIKVLVQSDRRCSNDKIPWNLTPLSCNIRSRDPIIAFGGVHHLRYYTKEDNYTPNPVTFIEHF
jgi:predicted phosphodiesterase